jgi:hypothetical protein
VGQVFGSPQHKMPTLIEEIPVILRSAVLLFPELLEIPILGRVFVVFGVKGPTTDTEAMEQLQRDINTRVKTKTDIKAKNSRYVIKVSEAMKCVDKTLDSPSVLLSVIKSIARMFSGSSAGFTDQMSTDIYRCLEENRLRQDTPRVFSKTFRYHRPSKGHGKGRTKFGA